MEENHNLKLSAQTYRTVSFQLTEAQPLAQAAGTRGPLELFFSGQSAQDSRTLSFLVTAVARPSF